jgi:hypothetical protein
MLFIVFYRELRQSLFFSTMFMKMLWLVSVLCSLQVNANNFEQDKYINFGQLTNFKASELCKVAENTLHYLTHQPEDTFAVHAGNVIDQKITLKRVENTLAFICNIYRDDVKAKRQSRLHDSEFLKAHFEFIRWMPDKQTANNIANKSTNEVKTRLLTKMPEDKIFLTKYYTKLLEGSPVKTEHFNQALYALPHDEQHLSIEQAEKLKSTLTRFKYTRQQITQGALFKNKNVTPLVWLTEAALHDVLLQGTGVLKVDGTIRYFNVHRNNGISYNYSIGKTVQPRYWYFAEVPEIMGYGKTLATKIAVKPQVTFAGNVADLGLGKLVLVSYEQQNKLITRMGVLADQGGALDNNLFQLDLLVNSHRGWSDYYAENKTMPDYAKAWFMLLKE